MKRALAASLVLVTIGGVLFSGTALSSNSRKDVSYRLRVELSGIPNNSNPLQTIRLDPNSATDVSIRYEFEQPSGAVISFHDQQAIVPSAELPNGDEAVRRAEMIPIGPRLKIQLRPFGDGAAIIDATLSDTQLPRHDVDERRLHAVVTAARFVEPVKLGTPITLQWPGGSGSKMSVRLTVE